jgi:hypothetical protein
VTVKLNGHVRTVLEPGAIVLNNAAYIFEYNKEYQICRFPEEWESGRVYLVMDDNSCQWFPNPRIAFYADGVQPQKVLNLPNISQSILELIDEVRSRDGEFIYFDGINGKLHPYFYFLYISNAQTLHLLLVRPIM